MSTLISPNCGKLKTIEQRQIDVSTIDAEKENKTKNLFENEWISGYSGHQVLITEIYFKDFVPIFEADAVGLYY